MRSTYILIFILAAGLASCNGNSNGNSANTQKADSAKTVADVPKKQPQSKLSEAGTHLLVTLVQKYYGLKNALVATDATAADKASTELTAAADSMQIFLKNDSTNSTLKVFADTISTQSKAITAIKDETCERKRIAFDHISSALYGLAKGADLKNAGIFHEFCPMAFDSKGAYWLSAESEIKNPYFGKKMMECGEVTDSL